MSDQDQKTKDIQQKTFFCSLASTDSGELLQATAANYKCYVLLEYTGPFPEKPTQAAHDSGLLQRLDQYAKQQKGKLLLIRNEQSRADHIRIVLVDCQKERYSVQMLFINELPHFDPKIFESKEIRWQTRPFVAVCTNGNKDKCCAKFGFPIYRKFLEAGGCETWQCSHIGGDRFAANAVVFPYGLYYGRLQVADVEPVLACITKRTIHAPNLRGLSRLSFFHQAVDCHLRNKLDRYDLAFRFEITIEGNMDDLWFVRGKLDNGDHFSVTLRKCIVDYPALLTCTSHKKEKTVKWEVVA